MSQQCMKSSHVINCHAKGSYNAQKRLSLIEQSNTFRSYLQQLAHVTGDNPEDSEEPRSRMYDVARLFYNKDRARTQPSVPILRPMKTWQGMIIHKKPVKKRDRLRAANRQQASSDDEQTTRAEEIERAEIGDRPEQQEEIAPSDPEQDFEDD
ncbi:hypothetical protein RSOLAG22IIIB_10497 [Rhizoctonia solani]|uniref:Uncharacterized protein n=1 Tax=Rhizoctonia solani TaxID=456999 RepID=A0A0K6G3W9_9AGAM|nr:hypothetical protein RSOLAG22IIIB_10497 [Rhizoctonia solani]